MCEPVTAMMAISAATAATSMYSQGQSAKAQSKAMKQAQASETAERKEATEEDLGARLRVAREQRSRARVAAGESGAAGASFAAQINQSLQDQDMSTALTAKNLAFSNNRSQDALGLALINTRGPSAVEAGLSIANATASGYQSGTSIKNARQGK